MMMIRTQIQVDEEMDGKMFVVVFVYTYLI